MPIQTVCSSCSVKIKVKDELIGKAIKCPKCGGRIAVPANPGGVTVAANAAQGALPGDPLGKPDYDPSDAVPGPDATSDIAPGSRPAAPALAPDTGPSATEFLSTPDGDASATQAFPLTADAAPALASPKADGAGEEWSLGGYRILREVGQGGMGAVYEAEDVKLKRHVALKVMRPEIAKNQQHRERFLREARTAAKVESDFICPIYRVGEDNGVPFIAMPFLKGEPLNARWKQNQRLAIDEVVRLGKEVAQGLNVAHDAGLVHRDIKPANIWLETQRSGPPRAVILDFGLARKQADDVQITQSGAILGTPAFMSPEQARGDKNVDARTDLFSLGCVLYALCTGELPFQGDTTMGVLMALATHDPAPPHKISAATPKPLSRLIMRLLAKRPADRPQSAREVIEELVEIEKDPANPAMGAFTTQFEPPLPPDTSADWGEPNSRGAGKSATRKRERQSVAAPSTRMRTVSYVLFGLIGVGLLVCVAPLAGGGVYYFFFADGKGADPPIVADEGKGPEGKAPPVPTGEVPAGWVVVKSPAANYTVAMPQQPVNGPNGNLHTKLPNGTELAAMRQVFPPALRAQFGGGDRALDQLMLQLLLNTGALQPGAKIPEATKISLGQYNGRECRLMGKGPQGPRPMYVRAYLMGNYLVMLTGSARGDAPAPETVAFFNSLKLGGRELDAVAEDKQPIHEVGQGLEQRGQLDRQTATFVYKVNLAAGKTYVIDMVSPNQPALDPYLVLTDAAGKELAEDDDGGGGLNARIVFRPEQAGTFRILATSFNFGAGAFTLTVRETANPPKTEKK